MFSSFPAGKSNCKRFFISFHIDRNKILFKKKNLPTASLVKYLNIFIIFYNFTLAKDEERGWLE